MNFSNSVIVQLRKELKECRAYTHRLFRENKDLKDKILVLEERGTVTKDTSFDEGYRDAYYGKDKGENYEGLNLNRYLEGQKKFYNDWLQT